MRENDRSALTVIAGSVMTHGNLDDVAHSWVSLDAQKKLRQIFLFYLSGERISPQPMFIGEIVQ